MAGMASENCAASTVGAAQPCARAAATAAAMRGGDQFEVPHLHTWPQTLRTAGTLGDAASEIAGVAQGAPENTPRLD